ncbi:MAG: hypothetical protein KDC44_07305, partial [Phaeodactylibacter sp.]|nr:hypothetical protein [Phaeodactylibacter sp.]
MRKISQSIIYLMVAWCLGLPQQAKADLFSVTSIIDGAAGSLRVAISGAAAGDTIQFSPLLDGLLNTLASGDILIEESIVIMGNGINATQIHGNNFSRIFRIAAGAQVTIQDLTLDGGSAMIGGAIRLQGGVAHLVRVRIRNSVATGDMATQGGGALVNEGGTLTLDDCELLNCSATGASGSGGAILNLDGGVLTIQNTTIAGNVAARAGGGIEDNSGNTSLVSLVNVQLMDNSAGSAPGNGGAVHITGNGDLSITGGVVSNNTASAEGGGLWNGTGAMTINGVTIANNAAGGAAADQGGGGVFNAGGAIMISGNTIIQDNTADGT